MTLATLSSTIAGCCGKPGSLGGPATITVKASPEERRRGYAGIVFDRFDPSDPTKLPVADILPGSPGEFSDIRPGDVLIEIDGQPISGEQAYADTVTAWRPGDVVMLKLLRDEQPIEIEVRLIDFKQFTQLRMQQLMAKDSPDKL